MKDVRFIAELIDKLRASYNIDATRIYANGFSNGGGMAFVLSCTLSDRIAAVGMVGAAQTLPWNWCTDRRPVPAIVFHGTADPFAPYSGGTSADCAGHRAVSERPACGPRNGLVEIDAPRTPVESAFAPGVTRREYTGCAGGNVRCSTASTKPVINGSAASSSRMFVCRDPKQQCRYDRRNVGFFRAHPLRSANAQPILRTSGSRGVTLRACETH